MKQEGVIGVSLAAAMALSAVVWVVLPSLEAAPQRVEREAGVHIERARRLFHQYNANLGYQALLVETLRDLGVDATAPEELSEDATDVYQEAHTELWESYTPMDWSDSPRQARTNYGNINGQIGSGVRARTQLIADNDALLKDAAFEVDAALAVTAGGVDGRSQAEATRLKAIIEYYQGLSLRLRAGLMRNEAMAYRRELAGVAGLVEALNISQTVLEDSGIDTQLDALTAKVEEKTTTLREQESALKALDKKIADLERRIASAEARRDKARRTLDKIRAKGIDFSDPQGSAAFATQITEQDRVYREAIREMESLRAGSYPYAQIDATGDYVHGRYLENGSPSNLTIEPGLTHYQGARDIAAAELKNARDDIDSLQAGIASLNNMRETIARRQKESRERIVAIQPESAEILDDLTATEDEAAALEADAIAKFTASARTSRNAASLIGSWVSDARGRTQSLPSEKQESSGIYARTKAAWMGGHIAAQGADAELSKAWIYYDQYLAASQNAALFSWLPPELGLTEADAETESEAALEARDNAAEAIAAVHAILERAHRDADRHWTMVAQAAGATYILALLGDESYAADAIDGYREALKGRETEPYVQRLASRLRLLESR